MPKAGVALVTEWALDRAAVRTSAVPPVPFPAVAELLVVGPHAGTGMLHRNRRK